MLKDFIIKKRLEKGMSQEYVASIIGVSRPTYIEIEKGNRDLTITEAKKVASLFDLSLTNLLQEKDLAHKVVIHDDSAESGRQDMEIRVQKKDLEKFKQVFLYILNTVGSKPNVGETVIHKILYFIDFDYYEKYEENLMGLKYVKNHHGPTSVELGSLIEKMKEDGEIEEVKSKFFKYEQKKYLPHKEPDMRVLSAQEKEHIDHELSRFQDKTATYMRNYSHGDIPWIGTEEGKMIPYESVFYRDDNYSQKEYDDEL
ncbi:MAG: DUF4065 domain-containing protein [Candidatus Spechtbacteria bacterium SB0662_bin_43]|uniref:DUF4065 domain-containing protein n=1 Tax=Candidatus Spechtbacteria bacterium SB0662_bin_43 TaxID=2604897 RepID=A0A845DC90_9BACT|nr:DUF4065 domain-containing protein [Candidatus Spechtbacteria bacterium SB0662_bin_43]